MYLNIVYIHINYDYSRHGGIKTFVHNLHCIWLICLLEICGFREFFSEINLPPFVCSLEDALLSSSKKEWWPYLNNVWRPINFYYFPQGAIKTFLHNLHCRPIITIGNGCLFAMFAVAILPPFWCSREEALLSSSKNEWWPGSICQGYCAQRLHIAWG